MRCLKIIRIYMNYITAKNIKHLIRPLLLCIICLSCNNHIKHEIAKLKAKPIIIPLSQIRLENNNSEIIPSEKSSNFKLVVYYDSTKCSLCEIEKIYLWKDYIDDVKNIRNDIDYIFIFTPKEKDSFALIEELRKKEPTIPVYIDSEGTFMNINPHIPKDPRFHTLLLDENNNVILVGDPLHNKKLLEMYDRVIKEKIGI